MLALEKSLGADPYIPTCKSLGADPYNVSSSVLSEWISLYFMTYNNNNSPFWLTNAVVLWNMCHHYTDASIDAPPSFKPAKKYSDLSGLAVSSQCIW